MDIKQTDILVIGGGGAGICAALSASENKARIILIEKEKHLGGSTAMSGGGISAAGTKFQKQSGIKDSKQAWLNVWKKRQQTSNSYGPYPDYNFVKDYMDSAVTTTEWLSDKEGHSYETPAGFGADPAPRIHFPKGAAGGLGGGRKLIENLSYTIKNRKSIQILTSTSADKLLTKDSQVIGAEVKGEKRKYLIYAKKVIIATGGFVHNKKLFAKYVPQAKKASNFAVGGPGDTGDGIMMAYQIGAPLYSDPWIIGMGITTAIPDTGSLLMDWNKLYVDGSGLRFVNEASHYAVIANAVLAAKNPWVLFDSRKGNQNLISSFEKAVKASRAIKADNIKSLASKMEVSVSHLKETVNQYNNAAQTGSDKMGKAKQNIVPLKTPPYYAANIYPVIMGTFGGVKTNKNYEVLDKKGRVIANLFAIGESANKRLYNHVYMSGSAVQFALTSGRVAGKMAAKQI